MTESVPDRIGKYVLEAELGSGGFGRVYRALDPALGRTVAIKTLAATAGEKLLSRFRNEAALAARLQHNHIVSVYEFGEHKGLAFLAMEYLDGEDLEQAIAAGRPATLIEKVTLMAQVAAGLDYAHRRGVVHRDIKPANLQLLAGGTVKIVDFGIARLGAEAAAAASGGTSIASGTLLYLSPERVRGEECDALSDVFAYGVTYYELLTGTHPFRAADPTAIFYRITSEDPPPVHQLAPECPEALEEIVHRAMHKDRELRYRSMADLMRDAEGLLADLRRARADELLAAAKREIEDRRFEHARELLNHAAEFDPAHAEVRRFRTLLEGIFRLRALEPKVEALAGRAEEAALRRDYGEALARIDEALRLDPGNDALETRRQAFAEAAGSVQRAAAALARARQELASDPAAAFRSVSEAVELDPANRDARAFLKTVEREIGRRERERRWRERLADARESLLAGDVEKAGTIAAALSEDERASPEARELITRIETRRAQLARAERLREGLETARELLEYLCFAEAVERLQRLSAEFPEDQAVSGLLVFARQEAEHAARAQAVGGVRERALALAESKQYRAALEALAETPLTRLRETIEAARLRDEAAQGAGEPELAAVERDVRACVDNEHFADAVRLVADSLRRYRGEPRLAALGDWVQQQWRAWHRREEIGRMTRRSEALAAQGAFDEALQCLAEGLAKYTDEAALFEAKNRIEADRDRHVREIAAREEAEQLIASGEPERALAMAEEFGLSDLLARARAALETKQREQAVAAALHHIESLIERNEFDQATAAATAALTEHPGDPRLLRGLKTATALKSLVERQSPRAPGSHHFWDALAAWFNRAETRSRPRS